MKTFSINLYSYSNLFLIFLFLFLLMFELSNQSQSQVESNLRRGKYQNKNKNKYKNNIKSGNKNCYQKTNSIITDVQYIKKAPITGEYITLLILIKYTNI